MYLFHGVDFFGAEEVDEIDLAEGSTSYFGSDCVLASDFVLPEFHF